MVSVPRVRQSVETPQVESENACDNHAARLNPLLRNHVAAAVVHRIVHRRLLGDDMGEFADYANDEQMQSLEELMLYESGGISKHEAMERGILDEDGSIPTHVTIWGVHDVDSLEAELDKCDSILLAIERRSRKPEQVWVSGGKVYSPSEMTVSHLTNAIAFAKRKRMTGPAVDAMKRELKRRASVR
jgi:hypothetical protein